MAIQAAAHDSCEDTALLKKQLEACYERYSDLLGRRDLEALLEMLTPDYRLITDEEEFDRKGTESLLREAIASSSAGSRLVVEIESVQAQENAALVIATERTYAAPDSPDTMAEEILIERVAETWIASASGWKIKSTRLLPSLTS